jgi:dienelactone hydrolase
MVRVGTALVLALMLELLPPTAVAKTASVVRVDVCGVGRVAHLHRPAAPGRYPAVLLVGGSGGGIGWQDQMGELLARRGVVALALAYFGMPGLASELDRIPLEYVNHALTLLATHPAVDSTRVGIGGVSKGGELALLVASLQPMVRAVAVFVPSGLVFQGVTRNFASISSWSYRGQEIPYVPYGNAPQGSPIVEFYRTGVAGLDAEALEAATIKVEQINGPILMLSGREDNLWPSTPLSEGVVDRLRAKGFSHPVEHIAYENAGHLISSIRDSVTFRGGTEAGNRQAQLDGQRRFLEFFERALAAAGRRLER